MGGSQRSMEEDRSDREVSRLNAEGKRHKERALHLHAENKVLIELLRLSLELTKYAAAAYAGDEKGRGSPDWFNGLREQLEELQPKLISVIESHDKGGA